MERRAYLIDRSFKFHMSASIMTMTAMNLNSIIDGILMGRLLASDAFSAINVVMPVVSCISSIGLLFSQGIAMKMAKHLGAMEKEKANQVFTTGVISLLIVGLIVSGLFAFSSLPGKVVALVCVAKDLYELALRYASVLMVGALLLIAENGMSTLVDVMGNPQIVTIGTIAKTGTNIFFDIIFVTVFKMDIASSAFATLLGSVVGITIYMTYTIKKSGIKFRACLDWLQNFTDGLLHALPGFIGNLTAVALYFICNYFIMANQGSTGMFVMSMGYTLISIGSIISNGVGMSYAAIGGMLLGQEDYYGLRALFKRGIAVTVITPICFNILSIFSRNLAVLFNADTLEKIEMAGYAIPLVCTILFALGIVSSMVYLHTILGHRTVSTINTILILISVLASFYVTEHAFSPDKIWLAFPFTTIFSLLVFFADTSYISLRSDGRLQMISLIPEAQISDKILDISVECNMDEKGKAIDTLVEFLRENAVGGLENNVVHCLDELMMNIITFAGHGDGTYMDLRVIIYEDKITALLSNEGKPFDPVEAPYEKRKAGLKMVSHYCRQMEYRYSFGQNYVVAKWDVA